MQNKFIDIFLNINDKYYIYKNVIILFFNISNILK